MRLPAAAESRPSSPPLQAIITDTVVLRGRYQTLPIALYGWNLQADATGAPSTAFPYSGVVLRPFDDPTSDSCAWWLQTAHGASAQR